MTLEWRHVFPNLGRNKGLREMLSRAQLRRWNQMVFKRRLRMNNSIKLLSRIFKVFKNLNSFKNNQEKMLFSFFKWNLRFFLKCNIYERTLYGVCVRLFKLGKWRTYGILKIKMAISTLFPGISAFYDFFQILSDFGRSKSVLESFLAYLTKNWPKNI